MLTSDSLSATCRLCGGSLSKKFSMVVLDKYKVWYNICNACDSLQTDKPFWLSETYDGTRPNLDYGAARRALKTCSAILMVSTILGFHRTSRVLDFGGGDGLVCRFLRDIGFQSFVYDAYATNFYAYGFSADPKERYDLICAIEVFEHLAEPNVELSLIFSNAPRAVLVATGRYAGQGDDWTYLGPDQGGHVFFYSKKAMELIAGRFGYDLVLSGTTTLFVKDRISPLRRAALAFSLSSVGLLLGRLWLQLIRPRRGEHQVTRQIASR